MSDTTLESRIHDCRHCPRMRAYQRKNQQRYPDYWNRPVSASGPDSPLTIIGLAPGLHGANKTGIPFTGDASGDLLFKVLDELDLTDKVRITNAVKCAPPENNPKGSERKNCRKFLTEELQAIRSGGQPRVLFCLGKIAHDESLTCLGYRPAQFKFGHNQIHQLENSLWLVDSYHCSRYNIQTNRLTEPMFKSAVQSAMRLSQIHHADI